MEEDKVLRFAPIARVSTEKQKKDGESLDTQKKQIEEFVKSLGGVLIEDCWKYSGQESATGNYRKKLDALLEDSAKGIFDAVIVCDATRWARDNTKSESGLETLKRNNIHFYVGTTPQDLYNPQVVLFLLSIYVSFGKFQAMEQCRKSMLNRIERAKRNIPTNGKLPYGRTFNGGWGIDEEKRSKIEWAAKQYLAGESIVELAKQLGINFSNLWKILTQRCGTSWQIQFKSPKLNMNETVPIEIPRLLEEDVIEAILKRAASNKTYTHGEIKHEYLLSRMIFCAECGYAMAGQNNHSDRKYYRHARQRVKECCCKRKWVPAAALERAVVASLFDMFGDPVAIEKAIEDAYPTMDKIKELEADNGLFEDEIAKIETAKGNIVKSIGRQTITDDEAKDEMEKLRKRKQLLEDDILKNKSKIELLPTRERIHQAAMSASQFRRRMIKEKHSSYSHFASMSYEDKKALVIHAFAGLDSDGKRLGVYMKKDSTGNWSFLIKGIIPSSEDNYKPLDADWEGFIAQRDVFDPSRDLGPEDFIETVTRFASY